MPSQSAGDIAVLAAHAQFLSDATGLISEAGFQIRSPGDVVVLAIAARVMQIAHALHELCGLGYAGEAAPLARSVLSGVVALVAICEPRKDGLALSFLRSIAVGERRVARLGSALGLDAAATATLAEQLQTTAAANLQAFERVEPVALGPNSNWWHGLRTERDLFVHVGMTSWYDVFYTQFSDEAHVGARALSVEAAEVQRANVTFGAKWEPAWEPLFVSGKCISELLRRLSREFGGLSGEAIDRIDKQLLDVLNQHVSPTR